MKNFFTKQRLLKENENKKRELLINLVKTKEELQNSHTNFEYAENDMIDYYSYMIKAERAKLDYFIKEAKQNKIKFS